MFGKILIANRGEIACRVIRTARRMGIRTVAVYSDADAEAMHVQAADEAYPIGPAPAGESYLRGDVIIEVARKAGAEAVHPGYGFLSENADFAEACTNAGLVFIGPPRDAIRAMGSKSEAKAIMERAGVPTVPGYHQHNLDLKLLANEARRTGFPVIIKAVAGGGGRGMRIVRRELDLADMIKAARREAASAFGDDRIIMEKYLRQPRHIEVQVFLDNAGEGVYLFERDCSIQRRHQKIVEEAPAPRLDDEKRAAFGDTALQAAKAIGYVGAGTVEFIVDAAGNFYFMEMNTRLQVEHPVTEFITGHDLVEWQIRVAAGEPLPARQDDLSINGHAIEARIYAEDPDRQFTPSVGRIVHMRMPAETDGVRVDTGVREGDAVSPYYDPMIAKLVVWDVDRAAAVRRMRSALDECQIVGVRTNIAFLSAVVRHGNFASGEIDTGFVDRFREELLPEPTPVSDRVLALAGLDILLRREDARRRTAEATGDPYSPWHAANAWRLNGAAIETLHFLDGETAIAVSVRHTGSGYEFGLPGGAMTVSGRRGDDLVADLDGVKLGANVVPHGDALTVHLQGVARRLTVVDPLAVEDLAESADGRMTAPMPGKVTQVSVEDGAVVKRGAPLLVLEAMKMEHTIAAPADGKVEKVNFGVGDWVEEGSVLVAFAAD